MAYLSVYAVTRLGTTSSFREFYLRSFMQTPSEFRLGNIIDITQVPGVDPDNYSQVMDSAMGLRARTRLRPDQVPSKPHAIVYCHHDATGEETQWLVSD